MTMRCDEILISTGWGVKEREERESVCVCVSHFELVRMSESGGGWITMRWFDRSSESKGERKDGDSPWVCMLWLWLS